MKYDYIYRVYSKQMEYLKNHLKKYKDQYPMKDFKDSS